MRRGALLVMVAAVAVFAFALPASAACIKRHSVGVANGLSPSGETWTLTGTIGNNGDRCREWLLDLTFELPGAGSWGTGTGIPPGGHLSRNFDVDAYDTLQEDGSERVFMGIVSGEVAMVIATLSDGKHLKFQPRSAPAALRRKVVWLRGMRYFVQFYPPEGFVTSVSLLSASGQLLYRTSGSGEGDFS